MIGEIPRCDKKFEDNDRQQCVLRASSVHPRYPRKGVALVGPMKHYARVGFEMRWFEAAS